jgi:hypothetical protein
MTTMVDPLETLFISWRRKSKTAAGQPENYSPLSKDVANRVDSELNRCIFLGKTLPAQRFANSHQPRREIFSEGWIMNGRFREPLATGTVGI